MLLLHFLQRLSQNKAMSTSDACQLLKGLICCQKIQMKLPRKREPIEELRGRVGDGASAVTGRQARHRRNAKRAQEEFAVDFSRATPEERKQAVRRLEAIAKCVETMLRIKKKL